MSNWLDEPRPVVPWDTMGEALYTRLMEVLVYAAHKDDRSADIRVVDGRGGDDGVDIEVRAGDGRVLIYQVKHFPEGFDGKHKARRRQISSTGRKKGSLETAIEKVPEMDEWVLVAPCAATRSGWAFIDGLRQANPGLTITFMDRAAIETRWVTPNRDVVRTIVSESQTLELTRLYGQEIAALTKGLPDQVAREKALERVSRSADPDWYWDSRRFGESRVYVLTPQHPRAQERSPVSITFTAKVPDGDAGAAFRRARDFGIVDSLEIPKDAVQDFALEGPPIVRSAHGEAFSDLRIVAVGGEGTDVPMSLEVGTDDNPAEHVFPGKVTTSANGARGVTIRQSLCGGAVLMTWLLPRDLGDKSTTDVMVTMDGLTPHGARRVTRLMLALSRATKVHLRGLDETLSIRMRKPAGSFNEALVKTLTVIDQVAEDLLFLEATLDREFPMPVQVSEADRIDLRLLRNLLQGKVTPWPELLSLGLQLRPEAERELSEHFDDAMHFVINHEEYIWQIDALSDHAEHGRVSLSGLRMLLPKMRIADSHKVRQALLSGETVDAQLVPDSELRPRLFLQTHVEDDTVITPEPWGLSGVDEFWQAPEELADTP